MPDNILQNKSILNHLHLFPPQTLRKGTNKLQDINQLYGNDKFLYITFNSEPFTPTFYLIGGEISGMECSCKSTKYCEHLAALLLYLYSLDLSEVDFTSLDEEQTTPLIQYGLIDEFRQVLDLDAVISEENNNFRRYRKNLDDYTLDIYTDRNDHLNLLLEENVDSVMRYEGEIAMVELKWTEDALFILCDECSYSSDEPCFHQQMIFQLKRKPIQDFLSRNFNIESCYQTFEITKPFPLSVLQENFYVGIRPDNQLYMRPKSSVELVNSHLIDQMERRLLPMFAHTDHRNSVLSEMYKEDKSNIGNAIMWIHNYQRFSIMYLEGKLAKNRKKLIANFKTTTNPQSIPFSIQYDLREFDSKSLENKNDSGMLILQKQIKFLQNNIDRLNEHLHYLHQGLVDTRYRTITKSNLHQFSFSTEPFTISWESETDGDVVTVRLVADLLKKMPDYNMIQTLPHFVIINNQAYVFRNFSTTAILNSQDYEKKFLFSTRDIDSMRRGVSQIVNHFEIDISDLDKAWVKTIPAKKRIIRLSQSGNRIGFAPLLEDSTGQNTFNLLTDRCLPATEGHYVVNVPDPGKRESFLKWFEDLHPHQDQLTEPLGFHVLPLNEFVKDHWFLDFSERCQKEGIEITGWDSLENFSFNPHKGEIEQKITDGPDWFDINFVIRFGDIVVPQKDWIQAVRKGDRSILLKDGSYGIIPEEWHLRMTRLLSAAEVKKDKIQVSRLHFNALENYVDLSNHADILQDIENKKKRLIHFKGMKSFELPESVQATLRSYQKDGYDWLKFLNEYGFGGCLADDMGLGKTLQVLSLLADQKSRDLPASLVVVPRSLVHNWVDEIEKFCPTLTYYIHHGAQRSQTAEDFSSYDLIISTYGTISNDIEWIHKYTFHYVILDESQAIKNPASLRYRSMMQLSARHRLTITGTPIENSTMDLFAQFNFINPGLLGNKTQFRKRFSDPIEKNGDTEVKDLLQKIIHPFLLRRTKTQVTQDLPPKTESILYCEMEDEQKKIYHQVRNEIRTSLLAEDELEKNKMKVLEGLLKLRQICNSPALLPGNDTKDSGNYPSVKIDTLMEQIQEVVVEENHSVLVFSQFTSMLALIRQRLDEASFDYAYLDGSTTNRKEVIDQFNTDVDKKIFLLSLKAGNVGLNLTKADFVYLIDPWWNPAVESQAIDRTHRIGQTQPVFAYRLICKDTIEEKIMKLQSRKNKLAEDLIQTDENVFKSLDRSELISLFE